MFQKNFISYCLGEENHRLVFSIFIIMKSICPLYAFIYDTMDTYI